MNTIKKIKYLPLFIMGMFFMAYIWDLIPSVTPKEMTAFQFTTRIFFVLSWIGLFFGGMTYTINKTV